jgi:hypothetical protein
MAFTKLELTSYGHVYLNLNKNTQEGVQINTDILDSVIKG